MTRPRVSRRTTTCSRGSAATAPRSSTCRRRTRCGSISQRVPRRDRRADRAGAAVAGAVQERVHHRRARRSSRRRTGSAPTSSSTSTRRPARCRWTSSRWRRLRGRRLGEVAVRRPRRRISLRAARPGGSGCSRPSSAGRRTRRRSSSRPGRSGTPPPPSGSRAARRTCRRSIRRGPATRSSATIGVPAIRARSLRLTRRLIDAAQAAGYRLNTPIERSRARRVGHHRRPERQPRSPTS